MERQYQIFYPNSYAPEEQAVLDKARAGLDDPNLPNFLMPGPVTLTREKMLEYAHRWNPINPLYNDPKYAAKTRWGRLPSLPCCAFEESFTSFPMLDDDAAALGDLFYYGNDGGDIELYAPLLEGDAVHCENIGQEIVDNTPAEGGIFRQMSLYGRAYLKNDRGEILGKAFGAGRNAFMRFTDGGPIPDDYAQTYEWTDYAPAVHYTTEAEWDHIRTLWKNEKIRGAETLWWDDVAVGDEPVTTCEWPISDIDMFRLHYNMLLGMPSTRQFVEMGADLLTDAYGQKLNFIARHYSYCRNPKARAVFYNFSCRNFILRMVSNWMGDDGFISAFKWRFMNLYRALAEGSAPGAEFLDRVPHMRGKCVNRHGMEGDTPICKGYVTDKYERAGKFYALLTCWAETLDGDIVQAMEVEVELPKKP